LLIKQAPLVFMLPVSFPPAPPAQGSLRHPTPLPTPDRLQPFRCDCTSLQFVGKRREGA